MNEVPKCQNEYCPNPVKRDKAYPKRWTKFCSRPCANKFVRNSSAEKIKNTCLERYGSASFISSKVGVEHIRKCSIEKYGVENPSQADEVKNKKKLRSLERFGVDNPSKSTEVKEKIVQNRRPYRAYSYTLPSGLSVKLQGYEGIFLDSLLQHIDEKDILFEKNIPSFSYVLDGVERRYYPDFYIPSLNLVIEVKSTWTYAAQKEKNEAKKKAVVSNGLEYCLVVFDATKQLVTQFQSAPVLAFLLPYSSSPEAS